MSTTSEANKTSGKVTPITSQTESRTPPRKEQQNTTKDTVNFTPDEKDTSTFKYYPDDPEEGMNKYKFMMKDTSEYYDPCQESSQMSFKCLDRNNFDRDKCHEYFDAYRECKKQWLMARRNNRSQWQK
ncbi:Cox23p NDAI_0B04330 [Naumovozyma dairenensis CBS 421]|uniref:Cytochrome c oxidase-assembly factor COX23, mitochondrial n=1 Tax=Naumovozyma dairenensis (strain ATCC 10597 / BCRC 20456 / CBS 421 / NBRC 0211 / NRRL Y-12639) TaxID=1071378 RepID=G0W6Q6_NAUDC|nr:hypothetical protein NDAI_0B04330 [Naumovozyma dairenensis CBS 421]CCD23467.1 hypothetical protein NDAI_0B04330 [Naumovozyma dairenensis CBS 421]